MNKTTKSRWRLESIAQINRHPRTSRLAYCAHSTWIGNSYKTTFRMWIDSTLGTIPARVQNHSNPSLVPIRQPRDTCANKNKKQQPRSGCIRCWCAHRCRHALLDPSRLIWRPKDPPTPCGWVERCWTLVVANTRGLCGNPLPKPVYITSRTSTLD